MTMTMALYIVAHAEEIMPHPLAGTRDWHMFHRKWRANNRYEISWDQNLMKGTEIACTMKESGE